MIAGRPGLWGLTRLAVVLVDENGEHVGLRAVLMETRSVFSSHPAFIEAGVWTLLRLDATVCLAILYFSALSRFHSP
jgi:hypothetical protein